jgi:hypothetical protein
LVPLFLTFLFFKIKKKQVQVLTHCTRLDLSGCGLEGPLPPQLSLMRALKHLCLADNGFSGPLLAQLVDCARLETVDLSGNQLGGELPAAWGRLNALRVLRLARNRRLVGSLPDAWAELANLHELDVAHNNFTGPVPAAVFSLLQPSGAQRRGRSSSRGGGSAGGGGDGSGAGATAKLKIVRLRGNDWDATIPRWPQVCLCQRMVPLSPRLHFFFVDARKAASAFASSFSFLRCMGVWRASCFCAFARAFC